MGVTAESIRTYTIDEYLQIERRTGERYEYYDGKIKLMAGGSINHNHISRRIIQHLGNALDEKTGFNLFGSDQKIYLPDYHYYVYTDAVVVTDGPVMAEEQADELLNP
ncbi:MAG: Uma2 family endonuclease, partial [Saprospiraceae bacterium]|nr:Uma2 family endonuclease [Saprospiraceae bacterium]